jgi:hypothetical protein
MRTLALVALVLVAGCSGPVTLDDVRKEFSQSNTCPIDRVEARERLELKPSQLDWSPDPPREIAADPGRLQMWQAERDKQNAYTDGRDHVFEARGCGTQTLYACHRMSSRQGSVMCHQRKYPAGVARW